MIAIEKLQHAWADICAQYKPGEIEVAVVILGQIIGFIIPATIYLLIDIVASRRGTNSKAPVANQHGHRFGTASRYPC